MSPRAMVIAERRATDAESSPNRRLHPYRCSIDEHFVTEDGHEVLG